jgi:hypothetical protein
MQLSHIGMRNQTLPFKTIHGQPFPLPDFCQMSQDGTHASVCSGIMLENDTSYETVITSHLMFVTYGTLLNIPYTRPAQAFNVVQATSAKIWSACGQHQVQHTE